MDKKQYQMLKSIFNGNQYYMDLVSEEEKSILNFLRNQKYIVQKAENPNKDKIIYVITELGKSKLYEDRKDRFRHWLPIVISNLLSLIAIVISIIALLK